MWEDGKLRGSGVKGIEREEKEAWTDYISRGVLFFSSFFNSYIASMELEYPVDKIVVEQLPPISSSPTFNNSAQITLVFCAISALIIEANKQGVPVEWVSSQEWKKKLFDDVKITKAKVRSNILTQFPDIKNGRKIGEIPFDQTDAIAIGWSQIYDNSD
jgi:hypothetical protein